MGIERRLAARFPPRAGQPNPETGRGACLRVKTGTGRSNDGTPDVYVDHRGPGPGAGGYGGAAGGARGRGRRRGRDRG